MSFDDVAQRLAAIAEELGDLAYDRLQSAAGAAGRGDAPDPGLAAEERLLTRARRSVEKAAALLREAATDDEG